MDGLSAAASGMAVVSLAFQLCESIKQLHDFWDSVKEASDDIQAIKEDLGLLSGVLAEMANEVQHSGPDQTLTRALKTCCDKVNKLTHITNELEPGFASRSLRIRKWTAFKAVLKSEKIHKFQKLLEGLKSTLILAQQSSHSRLNRIRYQTHQQDLTTITNHLCSVNWEQMSATVTTIANSSAIDYEHTNAFRAETSRICRNIQNLVHRARFQIGSQVAVEDLAGNLAKDQSRTSQLLTNAASESVHTTHSHRDEISHRARRQTVTNNTSTIRTSTSPTFFGSIVTTTRTRLMKSRFVEDDALEDEECQYEQETSFKILPAQWLLKLGFNYAYNFSTHDSSTRGWQWCMKPINLVPDDSPILEFCKQGNLEKVRDLFSRNLASVRDVDSTGFTPLHVNESNLDHKFAVGSHNPELCNFLIEAGADKDARCFDSNLTPVRMIYSTLIASGTLVNAIDTCRIFETAVALWDEDGDGWNLLENTTSWNSSLSTTEAEPVLEFCSWLVRSSSPDITGDFIVGKVWSAIYWSNDDFADFVDLLLGLSPPRALQDNVDLLRHRDTLLFTHILRANWKIVNLLLAWGADPHHVRAFDMYGPDAESPLSLAMYSSWAFWAFRNALHGRDLDLKEFARKELEQGSPLLEAGWQMETLTALFELEFEPDTAPRYDSLRYLCDSCNQHWYYHCTIMVQPYWQSFLESVKGSDSPHDLCSTTEDEQPSDSRRNLTVLGDSSIDTADDSALSQGPALSENQAAHPDQESPLNRVDILSTIFDRKEVWCVWCWYRFKETGRRSPAPETESSDEDDASEDDFSPFLIHT